MGASANAEDSNLGAVAILIGLYMLKKKWLPNCGHEEGEMDVVVVEADFKAIAKLRMTTCHEDISSFIKIKLI
jgi:hypothetical protein